MPDPIGQKTLRRYGRNEPRQPGGKRGSLQTTEGKGHRARGGLRSGYFLHWLREGLAEPIAVAVVAE
jgi:hypothetical protein